ncbi:MAG TPA: urease accessory protein UreF [Burkholderiaceae bacterium]|nr:urease accessory protein UreF [Burkholderiaceae bacterium]
MRRRLHSTSTKLTAPSLLQLMWLASPALPVGGFSYSEGLEAGVDQSCITNFNSANDWLVDQLQLSVARADLAIVSKAIGAWRRADWPRIEELNDWILQTRETSELRLQTVQMGRSMLDWWRKQSGFHHPNLPYQLKDIAGETEDFNLFNFVNSPTYPVVFALAASATSAEIRDCLMSYAFAWAENMVQAAVRAVPLGQTDGQRILANLTSQIPDVVDKAMQLMDSERQAFSTMLSILSSQHETQYSRLFRS